MNFMTRRLLFSAASLILLNMATLACNDETASQSPEQPVRIDPGPGTPPTPPVAEEGLTLSIIGESTLSGTAVSILPLRVSLTTSQTLEALPDEVIEFQITARQGAQDSALVSLQAMTNAAGEASNEIRLGEEGGQLTIRATHQRAGFVEWTLDVQPILAADLRVSVQNERPDIMELTNIDVRLYRGQHLDCSMFRPLADQQAPMDLASLATVSRTAIFRELDTRERYTLTALAQGEQGQIAASGCVDTIYLSADELNEEVILLELIPLIATGRYDVISYWNMTNVLAESGPVGSSIVSLFAYFDNPGQAIYDSLFNQITQSLHPDDVLMLQVLLGVFGLETLIRDTINDFIDSNQVLSQIRQAGIDLRDTVSMLKVDSILTVGKAAAGEELYGDDDWYGLTFYWRQGCDIVANPDCGQIRIGVGQDNDLGIAGSEWEGRVRDYNVLEIDDHMMQLNYGAVMMHILNNVILPGMTGGNAHSLSEAFAYWIGCDRIAQSLSSAGIPLNAQMIEGMCLAAVSMVFASVEAMVNNLSYPLDLFVSGHGTLIDEDSTATVDLIVDGEFIGYVQRTDGSGPSTPATATWSGVRLPAQ